MKGTGVCEWIVGGSRRCYVKATVGGHSCALHYTAAPCVPHENVSYLWINRVMDALRCFAGSFSAAGLRDEQEL